MKLRNPRTIRKVAWLGAQVIRAWMGTVRLCYQSLGKNLDPRKPSCRGRYIYPFWHEGILLPVFHCRRVNIRPLVSRHADGELMAEVCRHLGLGVVRGSTTRGGVEALLGMLRAAESSHLAVTPDGPRGPRRQVQPGVIYLAAVSGLPIVPLGVAYSRCWRARNWDRFALPRPFTTGYAVTGRPQHVPPEAEYRRDLLEAERLRLQEAMDAVTAIAENWAQTGRFNPLSFAAPQIAPLPLAG
jgi:lysophospholipid acyltransferase (LPLAT)-like uncharacterized protein